MTYRDDHEAALARVHALEQALAKERGEDEAREERIDDLEQALRDERGKLARAEAELATLRPEPPPPPPPPKRVASPPIAGEAVVKKQQLTAVVIAVAVGLVIIVALAASARKRPPEHVPDRRETQVAFPDDISRYLDEARTRRDDLLPGARVIELRVRGVDEQGALHPQYGVVEVQLHRNNPAPPAPPPVDRPIGAPKPAEPEWDRSSCATLRRTASGWDDHYDDLRDVDFAFTCYSDNRSHWREVDLACTTRAIWAMAIADGAPSGAIASITTSGGSWDFEIDDERAPFSKSYGDDCTPAEGSSQEL